MVKLSTQDRDNKILELLDGGRREAKDVVIILKALGTEITIWSVYNAIRRDRRFYQKLPAMIWH